MHWMQLLYFHAETFCSTILPALTLVYLHQLVVTTPSGVTLTTVTLLTRCPSIHEDECALSFLLSEPKRT